MASNGKRRSSSGQGGQNAGRRSRNSGQPKKRWWLRILLTLLGIGALAAIGLVMAVLVTMRSLPSYSTLKASEHGQMIVVRARDGSRNGWIASSCHLGPASHRKLESFELVRVVGRGVMGEVTLAKFRKS